MSNIPEDLYDGDTQKGKFLAFNLGEEIYALEIQYVTEIVGIQKIASLPEVPDYIKGIINLRGKVIPVIDVRTKFKKATIKYTDRTCIIVINIEELSVGLIVDNVAEVMNISDENIVPPPDQRIGIQNNYIHGIGKMDENVVLILSCKRLFNEIETNIVNLIYKEA